MRERLPVVVVLLAPLSALACLAIASPDYLVARGFPLDDAWIHATYAREFARSLTLAYNPGIAAAGETSPLWAVVTSPIHLVSADARTMVTLVKLFGFLLHGATAAALYYAVLRFGYPAWIAAAGGVFVGAHPDLVAASVSGMEIPLATAVLGLALVLLTTERYLAYGAVSACTFLARPETAMLAVLLPALLAVGAGERRRPLAYMAVVGGLGSGLSALLVASRNYWVTGRPLPSTYYAKVQSGLSLDESLAMGFNGQLDLIPVVDRGSLLLVLVVVSVLALLARDSEGRAPLGTAMYLGGLAFFAVSFVLVRPTDPWAFYHQRYVLPGLPLVLAAIPVLVYWVVSRLERARTRRLAVASICGLLLVLEVMGSPARYARLANDARNIDDVQVRLGQHLAGVPETSVLWAVDAGAARYFGNAFVVDLIGLNTPEMLTENAQAYLDAHPPSYLDVFPLWSSLDDESARSLPLVTFETTTPYTVTGFPMMRSHSLAICTGLPATGELTVRKRPFRFSCAAVPGAGVP